MIHQDLSGNEMVESCPGLKDWLHKVTLTNCHWNTGHNYSGDLNTELVRYSNGFKLFDH